MGAGHVVAERYVLRGVLGQGGAGTVYEATDLKLGHTVAVKILLERHPILERRMEREARVAAGLQHPNVCLVLDFGRLANGHPFIVMERLYGRSLARRLDGGATLEIDETLDIAQQVLSVLEVAHERGVVHRDIKPENLFLASVIGRPPLVKVLDFGVASTDDEYGLTEQGHLVGTPAYMSPEQAAATGDVDGRADLYAVGAVLYRCLTGRLPFEDPDDRRLLDRIIRGGAAPIASLRPDIPATVASVIDRVLRVERELRFSSALEMLRILVGHLGLTVETWELDTLRVTK